ncbi:MAG: hypothetical protein U0942_05035 [Parvibaculum sp.]|uniref:hypothetical protein n=1 Tax=Parvibaculum sp. TaxID=2024848 RepID=UPI002AB8465B|nr:hypothetical protein [Parvibaculum sp.]MDZ4380687.1 hypothetical protein [Parvibaculum sp.]
MSALPGMTKDDEARNRFINRYAIAMYVIFVVWNVWLGFDGLRGIDRLFLEVTGSAVNKPWAAIEARYGEDLAHFAFVSKARILTFLVLELFSFLAFLLLSGAWMSFLTPLPTAKENVQSLVEQGDLRSIRGYSVRETLWDMRFGRGMNSRSGIPRAMAIGDQQMVLQGLFWMFLLLLIAMPMFADDGGRYRRYHPEYDVMFLFMSAAALIWLLPHSIAMMLRMLLRNSRHT